MTGLSKFALFLKQDHFRSMFIPEIFHGFLFVLYWCLLLADNFVAVVWLTTFLILINFKLVVRTLLKNFYLNILPVISLMLFTNNLINEAKIFLIYWFSFLAGYIFHQVFKIRKIPIVEFFCVGFLMVAYEVISKNLFWVAWEFKKTGVTLINYVENLIFLNFTRKFINNSKEKLFYVLSFFSDSKALVANLFLMTFGLKLFILFSSALLALAFIFNPLDMLTTRIDLYQIFFYNFKSQYLLFGSDKSVNNLVFNESTIYSFHNFFLDLCWSGGILGLIFAFYFLKNLFYSYKKGSSIRKEIIYLYFICSLFVFSIFDGDTKYLFYFYAVIIFTGDSIAKEKISFNS
jgi:hypothetical protein